MKNGQLRMMKFCREPLEKRKLAEMLTVIGSQRNSRARHT